MAHGNPIYHICKKCESIILIPRFSECLKCNKCKQKPEQITKRELIEKFNLNLYKFFIGFNKWYNIKDLKKDEL